MLLRSGARVVGRVVGVGAIVVAGAMIVSAIEREGDAPHLAVLISAASAGALGGILYLLGLDRWYGKRAILGKAVGWLLMATAAFLPTSLEPWLKVLVVAALPAVLVDNGNGGK